ncbi:MAG: HemK/PrmC family methyltransferase [Bacteroidales bacterium]
MAMTIGDFVDECVKRLDMLYSLQESKSLAINLLQNIEGLSSYAHLVEPDTVLKEDQKLIGALNKLATGCPIQYVLGFEWFKGHKFFVSSNVLIPRPETEELVNLVIKECNEISDIYSKDIPLQILDVCTGSGCIAHSLAYEFRDTAKIYGCDISNEALEIANNEDIYLDIFPLQNENNIKPCFFRCDILDKTAGDIIVANTKVKLNIIVSNPPYVCEAEQSLMHINVLDFEPNIALFVSNDNPLLFYKRIAALGIELLMPGGKLFFEINERFGKETVEMLENLGYSHCAVIQDINGKDRIVKGTF